MGDLNEGFTEEELVTLGEVDEDESLDTEEEGEEEQEGSEGEQEAEGEEGQEDEESSEAEGEEEAEQEEGEEEAEEDTEEKTSVQKRIDEVVAKQKKQERELDFYRVKAGEMTRDEYFEKHQVYPATKAEDEKVVSGSDIWDMVIKGGDFDGERLGDIYDEGGPKARYALDLYNQEVKRRNDEAREQQRSENERLKESEREIDTFANTISQQLFDKTADKITETETNQINAVIQDTLDWMKETKRGFANIEDAYRLKNFDKLISDAEERGAKGLIKATDASKTTARVSSKKTTTEATGWAKYEQMTVEELAAEVDGMTESQTIKFLKNAPKSLRQKFPSVDWG